MAIPVKDVGGRSYVHIEQVRYLGPLAAGLVAEATRLAHSKGKMDFNVLRIKEDLGEVAFLHYPELTFNPFPALTDSWRAHPTTSLLTHRSYRESLNPPILHRTELLLDKAHPRWQQLATLTATCESLGLFDQPTKIGFRRQWQALVASKGYEISGLELVPISNSIPVDAAPLTQVLDGLVARHLTALSRNALSAPVQCLLRHGLLNTESSFFDYGCGRGDDMATLASLGYQVTGWDPYFRPDTEKRVANVVNIGFVLNVIEDRDERIDALVGAYSLATSVLAVASMTSSDGTRPGAAYKDGILTSRNTFQKYFTQAELQQFIETALGEDAYPAAPGVFYVFKDRSLEQQYLLGRSVNRSRAARAQLIPASPRKREISTRRKVAQEGASDEQRLMLKSLWHRCLELGRHPEPDEIESAELLTKRFRSLKRAVDASFEENGSDAFQSAQLGRRADIKVMLALQFFGARRRFRQLEESFKRDIRALFKSYAVAEAEARQLLFSVQDRGLIKAKCLEASTLGLGWIEAERSLQLHTSLIERLDPALRVYVGCATALAGDIGQFDLAKIHIESGKVTLMVYDDFIDKPLPALLRRVKARLREQELDVFEYGDRYAPTVLYMKSRYINEEFPHYAEQLEFDECLQRLGLFDLSGYGDSETAVQRSLQASRWTVAGFQIMRSRDIPDLDDKCGRVFTYRQLIECGETWESSNVPNLPKCPDTYNALYELCLHVLDPIVDYFGGVQLTYGFSSPELARKIQTRIDPKVDQHAGCEVNNRGISVCDRRGAAVDFLVEDEDMREVAAWIQSHLPFDRMYYYGHDRPLHISYGPEHLRDFFEMAEVNGRRIPRRIPAA